MMTTIQSVNFTADGRLKDYIESKAGKLPHFFEPILDLQIFLKLEKNKEAGNKVVEIKALIPAHTLVATERGRTFEEATDLVIEQIKRQLKKHKEKERE